MFKDTDEALARLEAELLREEEEETAGEEYSEYEAYDEEPEAEEESVPPEYVYDDTRPSAGPVIYQNYSNNYGKNLRNYASGYHAYNADISDEDPENYSEALLEEPEKSNTALVLIACLLSLTVAATILILALKSRGIL